MLNADGVAGFLSLDTLRKFLTFPTPALVAADAVQPRSRVTNDKLVPIPAYSSAPILMTDLYDASQIVAPGPRDLVYGPLRLGL